MILTGAHVYNTIHKTTLKYKTLDIEHDHSGCKPRPLEHDVEGRKTEVERGQRWESKEDSPTDLEQQKLRVKVEEIKGAGWWGMMG